MSVPAATPMFSYNRGDDEVVENKYEKEVKIHVDKKPDVDRQVNRQVCRSKHGKEFEFTPEGEEDCTQGIYNFECVYGSKNRGGMCKKHTKMYDNFTYVLKRGLERSDERILKTLARHHLAPIAGSAGSDALLNDLARLSAETKLLIDALNQQKEKLNATTLDPRVREMIGLSTPTSKNLGSRTAAPKNPSSRVSAPDPEEMAMVAAKDAAAKRQMEEISEIRKQLNALAKQADERDKRAEEQAKRAEEREKRAEEREKVAAVTLERIAESQEELVAKVEKIDRKVEATNVAIENFTMAGMRALRAKQLELEDARYALVEL